MKIHILGICGTLMSGIAVIAKQLGHEVAGTDAACYPPMSTFLQEQQIQLFEGYLAKHLTPRPDLVIIGNAMSRGNPMVEYVLNENIPFISGPEFLANHALVNQHVIAVAGTHGKTTTTSMIAWILEYHQQNPGFLIGGIPRNFPVSARLGAGKYFVIEADEYDSAFYDKRPKFMHYHPNTLVINQVEFDHADIYDDLEQIKRQFHYLLRTVPGVGQIIVPTNNDNVMDILRRGCWSTKVCVGDAGDYSAKLIATDGSRLEIFREQQPVGELQWALLGQHNVHNALAAIAACAHAGINPEQSIVALREFHSVKRRLELRGVINGVSIYDDFAHHPTAIKSTLAGLRQHVGQARIIAVAEFASYTMRNGHHVEDLPAAFADAQQVFILKPQDSNWDFEKLMAGFNQPVQLLNTADDIVTALKHQVSSGDHVCIMSNRGFDGIHQKLLDQLEQLPV